MSRRITATDVEPQLDISGDLTPDLADYARRKITGLAKYTRGPITHVRLRVTRLGNPALERPVLVQGNLTVRGQAVRAQVSARATREAIDLLYDRLRHRLLKLDRHWEARRGSVPVGGEHQWRHGQEPAHRPPYFPRPLPERQVMRSKTYGPSVLTPDEAAWDMELLDYDFFLFTNNDTGQDAVIYRAGPSGYRLAELTPPPAYWPPPAVPVTVSEQPAPRLSLLEAIDRLNLTGMPFLFFADVASGRGHVLYRRYDGHYGLITPVE